MEYYAYPSPVGTLYLTADEGGLTGIRMHPEQTEDFPVLSAVSRWLDGYEHTIKWESTKQTQFYISDTCDYTWSSTNPHILPNVPKTISKNTTNSFSAATLKEMFTDYADGFGNLYVRMRSGAEGKLRVKTIIPETPTGTLSATHGDRTTRLILRNNSIFIEVTDGTTTTLYDLTGRQVQ